MTVRQPLYLEKCNMNNSLITIIVPIYNAAPYLDRCITSIINQTYSNLQIILVDDGSTDASLQICEGYQKRDARIQIIQKVNGGAVTARKAGLRAAYGEYIGYIDADDWIEPDMYEHMLHCMDREQADLVETDHYIESAGDYQKIKSKIGYGLLDAEQVIPIMLCDEDFNECRLKPFVWSKLFKKELLQRVQLPVDERIGREEDGAVVYPYALQCKAIFASDYAGYHYVQRGDSVTGISTGKNLQGEKALFQYLKKVFESTKYASLMLPQLNQYAKSAILLQCPAFFDSADVCGRENTDTLLLPFGGVHSGEKIVIYGAGKLGQSIWRYLCIENSQEENAKIGTTIEATIKIEIAGWFDKGYALYQQIGLPVRAPQELKAVCRGCDKILVAVSSRNLAESIIKELCVMGIPREKLQWLTEDFINPQNDVLKYFEGQHETVCRGMIDEH